MSKYRIFTFITLVFFCCSPVLADDDIDKEALHILQRLSLKEKIAQKLMLDFRYWCETNPQDNLPCPQDFISMNSDVQRLISEHHIGGVILFANNLKTIAQITTLTDALQQTMHANRKLPLLIGTDQESGIVVRLPRDVSVTFPGNMALAAAYLGHPDAAYSTAVGKMLATDLKAVGINVDFAPDVDVNVNPLNPIINVRAFSDDPELVTHLGMELSQAIQAEGVAATLKHFPGHGDTVTDSHLGLPLVNHNSEQAWQYDLYPFKNIIERHSPDLIMTAHIQFPALDNTQIYAGKAGKEIIIPATLSRKIQHDLLRNQLGYKGVIVTDALNMGAIAKNFDSTDATIKAFAAGDDIALMPIAISHPGDVEKINDLINKIEHAVRSGIISLEEINESVLRILKLKIKLGLLKSEQPPLSEKIAHAEKLFADKSQRELEATVTNDAVTLVQNNKQVLPIKLSAHTRIHILTPWLEQGAGIAEEMRRLQAEHQLPPELQITFTKMADTDLATEKHAIENADIVIVGNITTKLMSSPHATRFAAANITSRALDIRETLIALDLPISDRNENILLHKRESLNEAQFAYQALEYAKNIGKKTIFISLLAPYDLPNYKDVADVMLVGYDFYGYLTDGVSGYYRGPSMPALTRVIFGISKARAKLPVNIPDPISPDEIIYPRGYGLTSE